MVESNGKTLALYRCILCSRRNGTDSPYPTNGETLDQSLKTIRYACEEIEAGAKILMLDLC